MNRLLCKCAALCLALMPAATTAGEISFLQNGVVVLTGEFAGFQDDAYVVIKDGVRLHVPATQLTCVGDDCLLFEPVSDAAKPATNS